MAENLGDEGAIEPPPQGSKSSEGPYFGPQFMEGVGKFATCADPQGASFSIIEPDPSAQS